MQNTKPPTTSDAIGTFSLVYGIAGDTNGIGLVDCQDEPPGDDDFCSNATVHEFHDRDMQIDVAGRTAVVTIQYEMVYERSDARYRATGRDLWVFERHGDSCLAVWRTMLDMQENAA